MIREKKYRKRRTKRKYRLRGHGFGSTLKNFASVWYHGLGAKWEEKKYAMVKLAVPRRVMQPNGRTFLAWYKRIRRSELVLRRNYTQRAAPQGRRRRKMWLI